MRQISFFHSEVKAKNRIWSRMGLSHFAVRLYAFTHFASHTGWTIGAWRRGLGKRWSAFWRPFWVRNRVDRIWRWKRTKPAKHWTWEFWSYSGSKLILFNFWITKWWVTRQFSSSFIQQSLENRYVPPHLRGSNNKALDEGTRIDEKLNRLMKGLLNKWVIFHQSYSIISYPCRLSEQNIETILREIEGLYRSHRRHGMPIGPSTLNQPLTLQRRRDSHSDQSNYWWYLLAFSSSWLVRGFACSTSCLSTQNRWDRIR